MKVMINFSRDIFPSTVVTMGEITLISANSFAIPSLPVPAIPILGKPSTVLDERTNERTNNHLSMVLIFPPPTQIMIFPIHPVRRSQIKDLIVFYTRAKL